MTDRKKLRLLLIGHMPRHVSGSSQLFKQLVDALRDNDKVIIHIIDTGRPLHLTSNWLTNFVVALKVTGAILLRSRWVQVISFHASRPAMMLYGPVIFLLARLLHKPLIFRLFGGALEQEYEGLVPVRRWFFDRTVLAADLILMETKHLVEYFYQRGASRVKWYSNSTQMLDLPIGLHDVTPVCNGFVFLGRVVEEKGIDVILKSVPYLALGISVDIYGSLDGHYTDKYIDSEGKEIVHYKGILTPDEVRDTLFNYDALILPTFYQGEGYPGVILEAYSHGLPVIATRWRSIPEIVDEDSGILIPPRSPEALAQAMNRLHADVGLYQELRRGVLEKRCGFSNEFWAGRFVNWCTELCESSTRQRLTKSS
jgi:glycosyltransferase involved in cell wall biosynthesis